MDLKAKASKIYSSLLQLPELIAALHGFCSRSDNVLLMKNPRDLGYVDIALALGFLGKKIVLLNDEVTSTEIDELVKLLPGDVTIIDDSTLLPKRDNPIGESFDHNVKSARFVFRTSGSSGLPKLVVHDFATLLNSAEKSAKFYRLGENDHWAVTIPLNHVGGFLIPLRCLLTDANYTWCDYRQLNSYFNLVSLVPTQLSRLLKEEQTASVLKKMRCILVGGAPLTEELWEECRAHELHLSPCYGMTETAAAIVAMSAKDFIAGHRYGEPMAGVEYKIEDGRIALKSDSLFLGYLEKTGIKNQLRDGFFLTQDLGEIYKGYLKVTGRNDRIIISGGENISPQEIENEFCQLFPITNEVAVVGLPHKDWGEEVVLFYSAPNTLDEAELISGLKEKLPAFKVPKKIQYLDELPKRGPKIDYNKLKKMRIYQ